MSAGRGSPRRFREVLTGELLAVIGVPVQRVNELVRGKRGVTSETAWLLAQAFETTPDFWFNLQAAYDLARTRPERTIPPLKSAS